VTGVKTHRVDGEFKGGGTWRDLIGVKVIEEQRQK